MVGINELADGSNESDDSDEVTELDGNLNLFVTKVEYTEEGSMPVTHVFGRTQDRTRHHIEVTGHRPSFLVDGNVDTSQFEGHYGVHDIHTDTRNDLYGNSLTTIETNLPEHVSDLREHFSDTYEADVFYTKRWLIDTGVKTGMRVDTTQAFDTDTKGDIRVPVDAIEPLESPEPNARVVTVDIEVASESGFPEPDDADWPVSTIVAHDNYTDEYTGWLLSHQRHGSEIASNELLREEAELDDVRVFDDEKRLLNDFNEYVSTHQFDLFTGWFSDSYDYPYLINRCRNLNVWSYKDWSPLGEVWDGRYGPTIKGASLFDMLKAYEKTQIHNLPSKKLDDIAQKELGAEKIEVEDSHTEMWKADPVTFLEYNKRDVELVVDIEDSGGIIDMFNHLRKVGGGSYEDCFTAIDMLDPMFLREAYDRDIALPTASKPDRSWFPGGYVFDPEPGLHEHVIYWDVASMYPYILTMLNISPETLVGFEKPDGNSVHSFVDDRPNNLKKDAELKPEPFYYMDPNEERGFVSSIVFDILELTETTSGKRREALKRYRNACWGVLGDGDSYGKGFRLFDWRMGESVTLAGRKIIQWTAETIVDKLHEMGYDDARVVVGDTDGVGVNVPSCEGPEHAEEIGYEIETYINEQYEDAMTEMFDADSEMVLDTESYASRLLTLNKKKKYAQKLEWER